MHYCCIGVASKTDSENAENMHVYRNYFITALIEMFRVQSRLAFFHSLYICCAGRLRAMCTSWSMYAILSLFFSFAVLFTFAGFNSGWNVCRIFMRVCVHFGDGRKSENFCLIL